MSEASSRQTVNTKSNVDGTVSNSNAEVSNASNEDNEACVVCFKNVDIYSIGECDHPVCYECSTRMRVLCQQNECPICRHVLSKVIFTYDKLPYRELEAKNRSEYYSKKYKIGFYDQNIQQKFFDLLDHPCSKCNTPPYRTFQGLKNHVRKEHDLHYCDLCTEHLKIFTFERRCYNQAELGLHRAKGDPDNRSHRGHPLCEYCNKRYLDRDELFRHLRREHYFCHFCDADGCNEFYKDYDALAEHFRQDHFLCEEGNCATEQFVGAFRSEIDYKAHVANVHGKTLNKQQAKQTRTLQLEITLGRRGRSGPTEQGIASVRSRGNEENHDEVLDSIGSYTSQQNQRSIMIDAHNEQDFPSLGGTAGGPSVSLIRPSPMRIRSDVAGLARTKENFPALGGNGGGIAGAPSQGQRQQNQPAPPISSVLRKAPATSTGAIARTPTAPTNSNGSGMVIHVSNRPTQAVSGVNRKPPGLDFPALPLGKSKKPIRNLEEDMLPTNSNIPMTSVATKHRTLVDDYVSVANPSNFQKIQMVQKEELEAKARKAAQKVNAPKLTTEDFPSLGGGGNNLGASTTPWVKAPSEKKQRELENRKSKVAPAPVLPKDNKTTNNRLNAVTSNNNAHSLMEQHSKKEKKNKEKKSSPEGGSQQKPCQNKSKEKNMNHNNNNNNQAPSSVQPQLVALVNGNHVGNAHAVRPPPGFDTQLSTVKPPPGFQSNVTLNSVAKSPNNLTFTSSLGESYSIVPTHSYMVPPEATTRNQNLFAHFKEALKTPEAFEEFRQISQNFRLGIYKTQAYYEHCQAALKDKFDLIFPELLVLLPDISKQQALHLIHTQRLNTMSPSQRNSLPKLEVCSACKQVLLSGDMQSHRKLHELKENFPTLGSGAIPKSSVSANRK